VFENRAGTLEIDAARDSVGETSAARIGDGELQRFLQPKAKEDARIRVHAITPADRFAARFYQ
jgi:hypothetical protein